MNQRRDSHLDEKQLCGNAAQIHLTPQTPADGDTRREPRTRRELHHQNHKRDDGPTGTGRMHGKRHKRASTTTCAAKPGERDHAGSGELTAHLLWPTGTGNCVPPLTNGLFSQRREQPSERDCVDHTIPGKCEPSVDVHSLKPQTLNPKPSAGPPLRWTPRLRWTPPPSAGRSPPLDDPPLDPPADGPPEFRSFPSPTVFILLFVASPFAPPFKQSLCPFEVFQDVSFFEREWKKISHRSVP